MKNIKISIIVVLYNDEIKKSQSIESILKQNRNDMELIVCDNSDVAQPNNKLIAEENDILYIDMKGNKGLSKAYNRAVALSSGDYVCIFDDDTQISIDYFDCIKDYIKNNPYNIILPIVKVRDNIFSPVKVTGFRYKSIDQIRGGQERISGINTGMVIPKSVFCKIKYNEKIFLDCVDHDFIRSAKQVGVKLVIAEKAILQQKYSRFVDGKEESMKRFKIFIKDYKVFCSDTKMHKAYGMIDICFLRTKYAFKYKNIRYLLV